jgi:glycosyltransferase involved in cell wall biosynthesis
MLTTPLISIVMPVYNVEHTLKEAIDSILQQTYKNFECILINDGSTDHTSLVAATYTDDRIRFFDFKENEGLIKRLNFGIEQSNGIYIARMDGDDIARPQRIALQVNYLNAHADVGVCGSFVQFFGALSKIWKMPIESDALKAGLINGSTFCHPAVMIRKQVLIDHSITYSSAFTYAEDYHLWYQLSQHTNFATLNQVLLDYRISANQVSNLYATEQQVKKNEIRKLAIDRILPLDKDAYALLFADKDASLSADELDRLINVCNTILAANTVKQIYTSNLLHKELSLLLLGILATIKKIPFRILFNCFRFRYAFYWNSSMLFGILKKYLLHG